MSITPVNEGQHAAEFMLVEPYRELLRETGIVITGQNLQAGTVLGKITASGKFTALNPAETDGSEAAVAIVYDNVNATDEDKTAVIITKEAAVQRSKLVWPIADAGEQDTAVAELLALRIFAIS